MTSLRRSSMGRLARESSIFSAAYLRRKNSASKEDSTFRTSVLRLPSVQILPETGAILRGGQALASDSATRKSLPTIYLHQSFFLWQQLEHRLHLNPSGIQI